MHALGSGGPSVSRMGLGLAALGRPGYINLGHAADLGRDYDPERMRQHTHAVLDAAWAGGVRYFDAARSYGKAEDYLGGWLAARGLGRGDVTIGSKWGYEYTANWEADVAVHEVKEHTLRLFEKQIAETRGRLGNRLAVYHIHSATLESGVLERPEVLRAMARLREQGVIPGLSLSGPRQSKTLRRALEIRLDGQPAFGCVQATWNVLEPSAGEALAEAHDAGWGVIVKEALANGRLTERNREPESAPILARLREIGRIAGAGVDAVALAAVLAQPWANVTLSGAGTVEQLESNLLAWKLTVDGDGLLAYAEPPGLYWEKRAALAWN